MVDRQIVRGVQRSAAHGTQRGISLLFALMALVVISLAAVALVRSVDTSSLVIGNLGFKQDATAAASQAAEQAVAYINAADAATLQQDVVASGYYAASRDSLDVTGLGSTSATRDAVDWNQDGCKLYASGTYRTCVKPVATEISLNNGANKARYIITRLCSAVGDPSTVDCATPLGSALTGGGNKGATDYGHLKSTTQVVNAQYYRIVVRSTSARGTVSFTETMVQR